MAFTHVEEFLGLAKKYRFDRLVSDEGKRVYDLLVLYKKERGSDEYLDKLIKLSKKVAMSHPNYLKYQLPDVPKLTNTELYVLKLLDAGMSNAQIAETTKTSVNNVKFHCKNIYSKLEVSSRHQAVKKAREMGILT